MVMDDDVILHFGFLNEQCNFCSAAWWNAHKNNIGIIIDGN